MDFILFGIQGSGKGTQGKILVQKKSYQYFETGGELRRLASEDSELGKKVKSIIEAGNLVPTEVVMEIVGNFVTKVAKPGSPIIFDGIPRNKEQSDQFVKLLKDMDRTFIGLYFELSREEAEQRLLARRICKNCKTVYPVTYDKQTCEACDGELITRNDDKSEAITKRLEIFYQETIPVIEEWKTNYNVITINAAPPIESVTEELLEKIKVFA